MDGHPIRGLISVLFLLCLNALVAAAEEENDGILDNPIFVRRNFHMGGQFRLVHL